MHKEIIEALQQRRAQIRARWEALLRIEKVTTPLANPDTLVFALDQSLDEIFSTLDQSLPHLPGTSSIPSDSPSPWRAYFQAGEQALLESLVLLQAEMKSLDPVARDTSFGNLKQVINNLTQREIEPWDAIHRHPAKLRRTGQTKKPVTARAHLHRARRATGA